MPLPPVNAMALFAHVVEAQGFSAAAERLGLSKSAVSKSVSDLEAHLGVRLLHRTTRRLKLTDAGLALHARASKILAEAAEAEAELGRLDGRPRGRLRVNAPTALGRHFVLPVVTSLLERYPDIEVDLTLQDDVIDLVATGTDVAVRVGRLADQALVARRLAPVRAFVVASTDYVAKHGMPETPEELATHPFILYTLLPRPDQLVLEREGERATLTIHGRLRMNNGEAILDAVLAGQGFCVIPDFYGVEAFVEGKLAVVLPDWHLPATFAHVVYSRPGPVTPLVRLFVDALAERAEELKARAGERPFALVLGDHTPLGSCSEAASAGLAKGRARARRDKT